MNRTLALFAILTLGILSSFASAARPQVQLIQNTPVFGGTAFPDFQDKDTLYYVSMFAYSEYSYNIKSSNVSNITLLAPSKICPFYTLLYMNSQHSFFCVSENSYGYMINRVNANFSSIMLTMPCLNCNNYSFSAQNDYIIFGALNPQNKAIFRIFDTKNNLIQTTASFDSGNQIISPSTDDTIVANNLFAVFSYNSSNFIGYYYLYDLKTQSLVNTITTPFRGQYNQFAAFNNSKIITHFKSCTGGEACTLLIDVISTSSGKLLGSYAFPQFKSSGTYIC